MIGSVFLLACLPANTRAADPQPVHERYWWLDEIRTVSQAFGKAVTGQAAQWPRMTVVAGLGTLPVPEVTTPVRADGRLHEIAWQNATSFPVGPIFADFRRGPLMLQVSVCRDEARLYLAIRSPHDLSNLTGACDPRVLFEIADRRYRIAQPTGDIKGGVVRKDSTGQTIELALPLSQKPIKLTFYPELASSPAEELRYLGLDKHKKAAWLDPIAVKLIPAPDAIQLTDATSEPQHVRLSCKLRVRGRRPKTRTVELRATEDSGVYRYRYSVRIQENSYEMESFIYVEPVAQTLDAAQQILSRSADRGLAKAEYDAISEAIEELRRELGSADFSDRKSRRGLYCRARRLRARAHRSMLDAPLLFTKRHPYYAGHIYDDYLTWHPGGGIYVIENPAAPMAGRKVRPVVDPGTAESPGGGVYRDPDLSWDGDKIVFAHKGSKDGDTSLYEIDIDGTGLKRLTNPQHQCTDPPPVRALGKGHHDITPAYLPNGRIVFTSTRPAGRVPCFNSEVDMLHVMNADGSDIRCLSVNNVNEFDPAPLPDGRILYGRWEYVDKTALYMQSLWTMLPDGTQETALFANNVAKPTAVLDARAVPGTSLIAASLTPHNGQAVGAIAIIDPRLGKNEVEAVTNFTPEYPVRMDQGLRDGPCDPWPLSEDDIIFANNSIGGHGIIELVDRAGNRELVHAEPDISCYSPMLVKSRRRPMVVSETTGEDSKGRFMVHDIYRGLTGVRPGQVKWLRIVEETTRISGIPGGGRWWNQAFLVSWQGAYVVKNILGVVPVHEDGSAYFEVPSGRALYFQALDEQGREIQRMRTFVQAAPGVTRSCMGCHENKMTAPANGRTALAHRQRPAAPVAESWGSGYIDYATMIQPILDEHCVRCHGGADDIAAGIDLSGGWTWAFNISYETLLKNNLVGFIRCHNSDTTSSDILKPYTIGSAAAPLTELLLSGHENRIGGLTKAQRELIMAWMDTNSNYYGTWNWTEYATCEAILSAGTALATQMKQAGCTSCHEAAVANDWVNLQHPEHSRILRAPLKESQAGGGLAWCRDRKARTGRLPLVTQRNMPPDVFRPPSWPERAPRGKVSTAFESTENPHYQRMLGIIRRARIEVLNHARVDMPGAKINPGVCRYIVPVPLPEETPRLEAQTTADGLVELSWERSANTIGLSFDLYRGDRPHFEPAKAMLLERTTLFNYEDAEARPGEQYYALVAASQDKRSEPVYAAIEVPVTAPPMPPKNLAASASPGQVSISWELPAGPRVRFNVYRSDAAGGEFRRLNAQPMLGRQFTDVGLTGNVKHAYTVRSVDRRGRESSSSTLLAASALPERKEPVFAANLTENLDAQFADSTVLKGTARGPASICDGSLALGDNGFLTYPYSSEFDLNARLSVECRLYLDSTDQMPVIISCGRWQDRGWFLQKLGDSWRWHVGGTDCDGGNVPQKQWIHLTGTYDGETARLFQDGRKVASVPCHVNAAPWKGPLFIGQYSAGQGPQYQVRGKIAGVKIYRRALTADEVTRHFEQGR
ncbi:MAG: HzsA-related protein [Planctomycetota bacterium]